MIKNKFYLVIFIAILIIGMLKLHFGITQTDFFLIWFMLVFDLWFRAFK